MPALLKLCRRLAAVLLLAFLLVPAVVRAEDAPAAAVPLEATAAADQPGLLRSLGRAALDFQRHANQEIGRRMRAIRDGDSRAPLLLGLVLAFAYGALHAAGPGHGKLVVGAYFLGREARIGRGLLMGCQIAFLHTLSAVVIVTLADLLLRRGFGGVPAEIPLVRIIGYGLILAIGLWMLVQALRRATIGAPEPAGCGHGHHHHHGHAHHGETGLLSLGIGLVPCTGSMLILLYAMANDMLATGILLVVAVALGMALTMAALGLAAVLARRHVAPWLGAGEGRAGLALEVGGAFAVTGLGAFLLAGAW